MTSLILFIEKLKLQVVALCDVLAPKKGEGCVSSEEGGGMRGCIRKG